MTATIFVHLLDEGTDVWRPVVAEHVRGDVFRITGTPPDDTETWEFHTGDAVRCEQRMLLEGMDTKLCLVAVEKIENENT